MICITPGCTNLRGRGRRICEKCKSAQWREKNPEAYVWHMLKKSAKKRRLPFTISLEYFKEFIAGTQYMKGRGQLLDCLNIDRKDNLRGYEPGNLKVITRLENIKKYHYQDARRQELVEEDLPF